MQEKRCQSQKRSCVMRKPTWSRTGHGAMVSRSKRTRNMTAAPALHTRTRAGGSTGKRMAEWSGNEKERLLQDGNPKALKEISTAIIADKEECVK